MNPLEIDRHVPADVRANIAAHLARFYGELSGAQEALPTGEGFSLARLLGSRIHHPGTEAANPEREIAVCKGAAVMWGQTFDSCRLWLPFNAIRTMASTPGSKGGYLVGTDTGSPVDVLRPRSIAASAGMQILPGLRDGVVFPKVATSTTATWIDENGVGESGTVPDESPPTLGGVSATPKTAIATIKFSLQLLRQGEAVEPFLRAQLLGAVGELIDRAVLAGAGGRAPLGLLSTPGINTTTGGSYAHASALEQREEVLAAGANEDNLRWVGAPAVQEVLGARELVADTGRFVWDTDGILGRPAQATKNAPSGTLVLGDFSTVVLGIFGPGIRIDIDPSQNFNSGGLVARVLLMCDVAFLQPSAFSVATSVS
jgi:HK97 family phage major capsid protein